MLLRLGRFFFSTSCVFRSPRLEGSVELLGFPCSIDKEATVLLAACFVHGDEHRDETSRGFGSNTRLSRETLKMDPKVCVKSVSCIRNADCFR